MKQFKRMILASTLMVGLAGFAVSCKYGDDLDDIRKDIESLRTGQIASVESQLSSLQATVSSLSSAKDALQSTVSGLESQLNDLKGSVATAADVAAVKNQIADLEKEIAALKAAEAALQTQLENLEKSLENFVTNDQLEATLKSYATVKEVGDAIAEVTKALGKFTTEKAIQDAINAAKDDAVKAAGEACEAAFQAAFDAAVVAAGLVDAEALNAKIAAYDEDIKAFITEAVKANNGAINEEIATKIGDAVADLQKIIAGRLTSVVLIPELYVNGIEAIEFSTYSYEPKQVVSSATEEEVTVAEDPKVIDLPSDETEIRYHVSPASVNDGDIEEPSFVYENPKTRAAEGEILEYVGYHVENGELKVTARKNDNAVILDGSKDGKITTVALRVPIAAKHLADGEGEAVVYSDYARIVETTLNPRIAALIDDYQIGEEDVKLAEYVDDEESGFHFAPNYDVLLESEPDDMVALEILYNRDEPFDLLEMVTGCDGEHNEITKEELNARGLEFRFVIPEKKYIDKQFADQQKYAKIVGDTKIVATYPNGGDTYGNAVSVGKTPIVRVELVNTREGVEEVDQIVDVRYFKIKWVEEEIPEENITFEDFTEFEWLVNCNDFVGHVAWDEFVSKVLATLNEGKGMTYAQFVDFYNLKTDKNVEAVTGAAITVTKYYTDGKDEELKNLHVYKTYLNEKEQYSNKGVLFHVDAQAAAQANTIAWFMTAEQIGQVIDEQGDLIVDKVEAVVTIPSTTGKSKLTFKFVMKVKLPTLASMNGRYTVNGWTSETVANVYPVQYKSANAEAVVKYDYDFDALYTNNQFLKNLLPCSEWKVKFAEEQTATSTYKGVDYTYRGGRRDTDGSIMEDREGYLYALWEGVTIGNMTAKFDKYGWQAAEQAPFEADGTTPKKGAYHMSEKVDYQLSVTNRADFAHSIITYSDKDGKYVDDKLFTVQVWARLNKWNPYLVHEFDIRFVAPVSITFKDASGLEDMKQNNEPTSVTLGNTNVEVKDFLRATVTIGSELGNYYGVEAPAFDSEDIRVNLKVDDNGDTIVDNTMDVEDMPCIFDVDHYKDCLKVEGNKLTWHNNTGFKLTQDIKLYVPATVKHAWGEVTGWVSVPVKHNSSTN